MIARNNMKRILISLIVKWLDVDMLCSLIAKAIAALLSYASKKGGKAWDATKEVIVKINMWTSLFMQVYEDETLTDDEEKIIADAIKNETNVEKLIDLVKKDKKDASEQK